MQFVQLPITEHPPFARSREARPAVARHAGVPYASDWWQGSGLRKPDFLLSQPQLQFELPFEVSDNRR
jgi:hypothetical protein